MENSPSKPLDPRARATITTVFFTLFIDLVGFSIIFPLFPAMIEHYRTHDASDPLLGCVMAAVEGLSRLGGVQLTPHRTIVLFGGILSGLYSLLQFLYAPVWGRISDRVGRKPVLVLTCAGTLTSYVLWVFSGSFSLLVASRLLGGVMAGNISTATAVIGDVTTPATRSRGMAFIGMAFGMGFLFGPVIGGLLSVIDLTVTHPEWTAFGINPFSVPAALACVLSVINLIFVFARFRETLAPEHRGRALPGRTNNPVALFRRLPFPGVNALNLSNFVFLLAFAGMEGTLTFLTLERFSYTPRDNGIIFVYIGILGALIQGGFVRRRAHAIGEAWLAKAGLVLLMPGLVLMGLAAQPWQMYVALTFLAMGSALVIPCLATLVSLFTPPQHQGESIGIFRSMGSLARALGPFLASVAYWRFGSAPPFFLEALLLLIPLALLVGLRRVPQTIATSSSATSS